MSGARRVPSERFTVVESFTFSPLLGIVGAAVLGGAIGLQRQAAHKAAGFRTHLIVAAASASFTAMGAHLNDTRIPSYVVVGIGFLGAGAIIRQGITAHGLTTAASIWMAAAVGLLWGYSNAFGLYAGLVATGITIAALLVSDSDLMRIFHMPHKLTLLVKGDPSQLSRKPIENLFREFGCGFESGALQSFEAEHGHQSVEFRYSLELQGEPDIGDLVARLNALPGAQRVLASEPFVKG